MKKELLLTFSQLKNIKSAINKDSKLFFLKRFFITDSIYRKNPKVIDFNINAAIKESCFHGYLPCVIFLIQYRANIYINDHYCLTWSCENSHIDTVQYLYEQYTNKEEAKKIIINCFNIYSKQFFNHYLQAEELHNSLDKNLVINSLLPTQRKKL